MQPDMADLLSIIAKRIGNEGPITFEAFMEMALYYPELGYYSRQSAPIGGRGDFVTSPHMHSIFGALLGRQAAEMWEFMGKPDCFDIVEAGGGKGYLCKDLLDFLRQSDFYDAISYTLVERNPALIKSQKRLLVEHGPKVQWSGKLSELRGLRGLILSNELFDAMPVHVVTVTDEGLREVYTAFDRGKLVERIGPVSNGAIDEYLGEFAPELPTGYTTEVNLRMRRWLEEASSALDEGFLLSIDYGYPAEEYYSSGRSRGTLLCYHRHKISEDPFELAGEKDMTAHINFSALKRWGESLGFDALGFSRQGPYLVSMGIDELIQEIYDEVSDFGRELAKIKPLVMPGAMGDTHKVLIQFRGKGKPELRGFGFKNELVRL